MKASLASLGAVGLLVVTAGWAGAEELTVKGIHRGTGIVVALAPGTITLREVAGSHAMTTNPDTRIVLTREDQVSRIDVGDYVAEECALDERSGVTALQLTLYRPAWMEHASPEN
jgi:hypothetical protein